jgi:hypothetical protein
LEDASRIRSVLDAVPCGPPDPRRRQATSTAASPDEASGARKRRHRATGRACFGDLLAACFGSRLARCTRELDWYPRRDC